MVKWECERYSHDEWVAALSKVIAPDCKDWQQSPTPETAAALYARVRMDRDLAWGFNIDNGSIWKRAIGDAAKVAERKVLRNAMYAATPQAYFMNEERNRICEQIAAEIRALPMPADLGERRLCLSCGATKPASEPRHDPAPGCDGAACTWDMTAQESWMHWRQIAHERYEKITLLRRAARKVLDSYFSETDGIISGIYELEKAVEDTK